MGFESPGPACGYLHPDYARSLAEFGTPRYLPASGGWILEREIAGATDRDAIGCYPLFSCRDWMGLGKDLDELGGQLVAISLVADPFGAYAPADLERIFDCVVRFKEHCVVDMRQSMADYVSPHHRHRARLALQRVVVERSERPGDWLNEWVALFGTLVTRHRLKGIRAFSPQAFATQLAIPGMVAFRAVHGGTTVGMQLWYVQDDIAYSHLAVSQRDRLLASYALHWTALEWFSSRVRWVNLGGGAGAASSTTDGLQRFKAGWSTGVKPAFFCGRVLDHFRYHALASAFEEHDEGHFPLYRRGEFC